MELRSKSKDSRKDTLADGTGTDSVSHFDSYSDSDSDSDSGYDVNELTRMGNEVKFGDGAPSINVVREDVLEVQEVVEMVYSRKRKFEGNMATMMAETVLQNTTAFNAAAAEHVTLTETECTGQEGRIRLLEKLIVMIDRLSRSGDTPNVSPNGASVNDKDYITLLKNLTEEEGPQLVALNTLVEEAFREGAFNFALLGEGDSDTKFKRGENEDYGDGIRTHNPTFTYACSSHTPAYTHIIQNISANIPSTDQSASSDTTDNAFVTVYDINSEEGKKIMKNLVGVAGHFNAALLGTVYSKLIVCKESFIQGQWQLNTFSTGEGREDKLTMKDIEDTYKDIKDSSDSREFSDGVRRIRLPGNKTGYRSRPCEPSHKTGVMVNEERFRLMLHDVELNGGALFLDAKSPENTYELLMASTSDIFGELISKEIAEVSV
jgi:hypothetical protein